MRRTREYTIRLLELVDEGAIDRDSLIQDLLGWMSEDEVRRFALQSEYLNDEDEEEDDEEEEEYDALDDFNYVGSRHHY
jgi:hypothetical protein